MARPFRSRGGRVVSLAVAEPPPVARSGAVDDYISILAALAAYGALFYFLWTLQ